MDNNLLKPTWFNCGSNSTDPNWNPNGSTAQPVWVSDFVSTTFPQTIWREVDDMFDAFWKQLPTKIVVEDTKFPKCNAWADDVGLHIHLAVPYITKEDLDVEVDGKLRKVTVKAAAHQEPSGVEYFKREISRTSFERTFIIGHEFDLGKITVTLDGGLLMIHVPTSADELTRYKKIDVS